MQQVHLLGVWLLSTMWLISGVTKMVNRSVPSLLLAAGFTVPGGPLLERCLPFIEVGLGLALLVAPLQGFSVVLSCALLSIFTVLVFRLVRRRVQVSCNCFGNFSRKPVTWKTVVRNVLLLATAVATALSPSPMLSSSWAVPIAWIWPVQLVYILTPTVLVLLPVTWRLVRSRLFGASKIRSQGHHGLDKLERAIADLMLESRGSSDESPSTILVLSDTCQPCLQFMHHDLQYWVDSGLNLQIVVQVSPGAPAPGILGGRLVSVSEGWTHEAGLLGTPACFTISSLGHTVEAPVYGVSQVVDCLSRRLGSEVEHRPRVAQLADLQAMPRRRVLRLLGVGSFAPFVPLATPRLPSAAQGSTFGTAQLTESCVVEYPVKNLNDCPSKRPHPGYKPKVNGCGPSGFLNLPLWAIVPDGYGGCDFKPACNDHDTCYGTCNSDRGACDGALGAAIKSRCQASFGTSTPGSRLDRGACEATAATYEKAVRRWGQAAFDAGQRVACECCRTPSKITYSADIIYGDKCTGECYPGQMHAMTLKAQFHLVAEADLTLTSPMTGSGQLQATSFSGSWSDKSSSGPSFACLEPYKSVDSGTLKTVDPGPFKILSLETVLNAKGEISDYLLHWQLSPDNINGILDQWLDQFEIVSPAKCASGQSKFQPHRVIFDAYTDRSGNGSTDSPANMLVKNWSISTSKGPDGTVATVSVKKDLSSSAGDSTYTKLIREEWKLISK